MSRRKSTGHTQRGLLDSHNTQNGKGDADRSPKWRDHYHEVDWQPGTDSGFRQISPKHFRKTYGVQKAKHPAPPPEDFLQSLYEQRDKLEQIFGEPKPFVQPPSPLLSQQHAQTKLSQ